MLVVSSQKEKGSRWERDFAKLLMKKIEESSAKRIAGSGSIGTIMSEPILMGDVVASFYGLPRKFKFDAKVGYGGATQLTLKREWFNKIREEAEATYAIPALACKFLDSKKAGGVQYFIALDLDAFCDIINYVNDLKRELDLLYEDMAKEEE